MSFPALIPPATFDLSNSKKMSAIYLLIGVSFIVALAFLIAFIWSIKNGQYEDDYSPGIRMLKDSKKNSQTNTKV